MQPCDSAILRKGLAVGRPTSVASVAPPGIAPRSSLSPGAAALPLWLWPVFVVLSLLGFPSENPALTAIGILVAPLLVSLLWRPGEPPILLACCLMQWLQVVTPVFHADLLGQPLEAVSNVSTHDRATWLSLAGVIAMALGMRLALNHQLGGAGHQREGELGELNLPRAFAGFLAAFGVATVVGKLAWYTGGLAQLVLAVGSLKWAFLWILLCGVFVQGRGYGLVAIAMLLEVGVGFLGYFSTFKEVFFLMGIALFSVRKRLSSSARLGMVMAGLAMLTMMIFWQAVKKEYRLFVSDGQEDQSVRVSLAARVDKLNQLLMNLNAENIRVGVETLVERVGYTEFFAATLQWVPANEPHTGGELFKGAVLHPLMPRLLFPDKAAIDDSEIARRFTGRTLSGSEAGTSIGIGYMAESYVDFGATLMFTPILLLGYVLGRLYRGFSFSGKSRMWGMALAIAVLFATLQAFATTGSKLFGAVLTVSLVMFLINRFVGLRIQALLVRAPSAALASTATPNH